jgi:hypothetical protein
MCRQVWRNWCPFKDLKPAGHIFTDGTYHQKCSAEHFGGQRDAHAVLQLLDAVEREPCTIFEETYHAGRGRIVFLVADTLGRRRGIDFAAQIAAQPVAGVDGGRQRRHAGDAHQLRRLALRIQFPARATGARLAAVKMGVCHRHLGSAGVGGGSVSAMARRLRTRRRQGLCRCGRDVCTSRLDAERAGVFMPFVTEYVAGCLGAGAEDHR